MANSSRFQWQFIDEDFSFRALGAECTSRLYFPLANEASILSSITPDLHGDIKTNHNSFLTAPVTIEDLHNTKSNRNFWVHIEGKGVWSLAGVSAVQDANKFLHKNQEEVELEAGFLWHKVTRENKQFHLRSEIVNFAPASDDTVEIMMVTLQNTGSSAVKVTPTSAIPIFGRSADNHRDHHHVTSLLHRVIHHSSGIIVKPTMSFDERGHKINETIYCVMGVGENGDPPVGAFSTIPDFAGEGGNLEAPQAIIENLEPPQKDQTAFHGKSAIGALRFKTVSLAPRQRVHFVLMLGIAKKESEVEAWLRKYGSMAKAEESLKQNKLFWKNKLNQLRFDLGNPRINGWLRWVSLQPTLRKLFGCSFLPDFDYGRGGRGWRDLWQDCLALLFTSPGDVRQILLNNFGGIRIDGSNATIIGQEPGEFIADRNNITRVWMDHGAWPYLTTELYIHQTGDFSILFQNTGYFRDRHLFRARKKDTEWSDDSGPHLKDKKSRVVGASVLEHMLVQHLVQFYNVGEHGHIRLENADWNDGIDMAYERGESVAFTCLYASNLKKMAVLLGEAASKMNLKKIELTSELLILLDRVAGKKIHYNSVAEKRKQLEKYFQAVSPVVSGKKVSVRIDKLMQDLEEKGEFLAEQVRQKEWISTHTGESFFNGYYDNHGRRVEGDFPKGVRMTLTGQVFAVMGNIATLKQTEEIFKTAKKYLRDKDHGGFRLNTDFHEIRPDLGRCFSFAYGEKENGSFFSHMAVMFSNSLYQRGFVNEGFEVLDSIYRMCLRTDKSKIFPGIPEYFNSDGRGLYHYLTGSASWLVLTILTQVFGVRGRFGDLLLAPKLVKSQFGEKQELSVETFFLDRRIRVIYRNPKRVPYEHYFVTKVLLNGKELKGLELNKKEVLLPRAMLNKMLRKFSNTLLIILE